MWFTSYFSHFIQKPYNSLNSHSNNRSVLISKRNKLNSEQIKQYSRQIRDQILSNQLFCESHAVALYFSFNNEVDLNELMSSEKRLLLPIIVSNSKMFFSECNSSTPLKINKYGILEPLADCSTAVTDIDICLMPLVGFNRRGDRLGMGGGYYDRYFANNNNQIKPTILIGIAYDFQEDDTISANSWDVPMDLIITNKEVINCGSTR